MNFSVSLDVFPVYEQSLDMSYYLQRDFAGDTSILGGFGASLGSGVSPAGSSGVSG